jgi:hypothetical protein
MGGHRPASVQMMPNAIDHRSNVRRFPPGFLLHSRIRARRLPAEIVAFNITSNLL